MTSSSQPWYCISPIVVLRLELVERLNEWLTGSRLSGMWPLEYWRLVKAIQHSGGFQTLRFAEGIDRIWQVLKHVRAA